MSYQQCSVFFPDVNSIVHAKLLIAYSSDFYSCELWMLDNSACNDFCIARWNGFRRALNVPYNAHSYTLSLLSDTLPLYTDICKRFTRFIFPCLFSVNSLASSSPGTVHMSWIFIHVQVGLSLHNCFNDSAFILEGYNSQDSNLCNFLVGHHLITWRGGQTYQTWAMAIFINFLWLISFTNHQAS